MLASRSYSYLLFGDGHWKQCNVFKHIIESSAAACKWSVANSVRSTRRAKRSGVGTKRPRRTSLAIELGGFSLHSSALMDSFRPLEAAWRRLVVVVVVVALAPIRLGRLRSRPNLRRKEGKSLPSDPSKPPLLRARTSPNCERLSRPTTCAAAMRRQQQPASLRALAQSSPAHLTCLLRNLWPIE